MLVGKKRLSIKKQVKARHQMHSSEAQSRDNDNQRLVAVMNGINGCEKCVTRFDYSNLKRQKNKNMKLLTAAARAGNRRRALFTNQS
jgi:hypothetical protein